ncbi:MAG: tRNA (5-methylaminomethyl-2-thiouridine)(34)-methyltransferase MnmD [Pseudomonadota bacterium]
MPPDTTNAKLRWADGCLPVSVQFDDPYYSRADGMAESRHVFLDGNDLAKRFANAADFHIAELGFGTGLNMLTAIHLWQNSGATGTLHLTSFEKYPMSADHMLRALNRWPELSELAEILLGQWPASKIIFPDATLNVLIGDVPETLPAWLGTADAWFLDGFAPSRNPDMWSEPVLNAVAAHTTTGGSFATYTAAGFVRRGLTAAGFTVSKRAGFGSKREMLTGQLI